MCDFILLCDRTFSFNDSFNYIESCLTGSVQVSVCPRSSYLHYADFLSRVDLIIQNAYYPETAVNHGVQTEICNWSREAGICCFSSMYCFLQSCFYYTLIYK